MAAPSSSHRPAPIALKELVFPKISVHALVPEGERDNVPRTLDLNTAEIGFQYQPQADGNEVTVGMRLRTLPLPDGAANSDRFYELDFEAFAVFELVGAEHRDGMAEYLRKASAASALLGAIREQVAINTARGPWGVLTIPLIGMDAIVGRPPIPAAKPTKEVAASTPKRVTKKKVNV